MYKQFYAVRLFFISLFLLMGIANVVTAQTIDLAVTDQTTGGDGTIATRGDRMKYYVTVTNNTSSNLTTSIVYGNIPLGGTYVAGSTTVNDVPVPDVDGKMPFGSGGLVNSPSSAAGVIAPNSTATVKFMVTINFAGASLNNSSSLQAINSSGTTITLNSNSTTTRVASDNYCYYIYQSTAVVATGSQPLYNNRLIQSLYTYTGQTGGTVASYTSPTYNAITGAGIANGIVDVEAIAVDPRNGRIYFANGPTNNPAKELCYYDPYNTRAVYKYVGYPLETNTAANYTITGMCFASDGNGYALTANYQDLIRFSIDPSTNVPTITPLGALINDAANGSTSITTETGGDIFSDALGRLYLVTSSAKLYRIDPATRNTLYLGTISGVTAGVNSAAVDKDGYLYISGNYQTVYKADLSTMTGTAINSGTNDVWKSSDYASCNMPPLSPVLNVTKSYINTIRGGSYVLSGEPVEFTITISNTGTINAGGVKLSDAIPAYAHYIAGSTTINGVAVADIGGTMPFAAGSQYINSAAAATGIVMPGDDNKIVIKFKVTTDALKQVCNQAIVTYPEINGSTVTINSDDPSQPGPNSTCFFSDGVLCENCCEGCSTLVNNASVQRIITAKVQPNPFRETINLQVQSNTTQQMSVRLIDFYGRTVYTTTQQISAGYNALHINVPSSLATGVYVLELSSANNRLYQRKLIKQ